MNWYVASGALLVGTFGDPRADARALWRRGGGIHCVTMQEPA